MLKASPLSRTPAGRQRGLSLVELMVGIAIGLFVVAAGVLGATTSLRENKLLLLEARLQQDLRATMDLITRDIRRAGYWGDAISTIPTKTTSSAANPHIAISGMPVRAGLPHGTTPVSESAASPLDSLTYRWDKNNDGTLDANEVYQFDVDNGVVRMKIGSGAWQAVTDENSIYVTGFSITPRITWIPLYDKCPNTCNPATRNCPEIAVRSLTVRIQARSLDNSLQRTLRSDVRVRNDQIVGSCS